MANTLGIINQSFSSPNGEALAGVTVAVLTGAYTAVNTAIQPGSPLATVYADPGAVNMVSNPLTTNGLGNLVANSTTSLTGVCVTPGYVVLQVYGTGISGQQLIQLHVT